VRASLVTNSKDVAETVSRIDFSFAETAVIIASTSVNNLNAEFSTTFQRHFIVEYFAIFNARHVILLAIASRDYAFYSMTS
jgi:hypothetical protein